MNAPLKTNWHLIAIGLLIGFALGTFYGPHLCGNRAPWKHSGSMREHMLKRFSSELHLTPEQKEKVGAIFDAKHPQMLALHAEIKPKFEALRQSTKQEIRAVLNADQQQKFDELNAKMEERWKKRDEFFTS